MIVGSATEAIRGEGGVGEPGAGGYAGIHCWKNNKGCSILKLSGDGILKAYGGNASDGKDSTSGDYGGCRRWWSWCRNRWKWR